MRKLRYIVELDPPRPRLRRRRRPLRRRPGGDRARARSTDSWWSSADPPADFATTLFDALLAERRRAPPSRRASPRVGPDTVAKILFTSGSTGQPKGVVNTQRMLCSNQQAHRRRCGPSSRSGRRWSSTGCPGATPSAATTTSTWCCATAARSTSTTGKPAPGLDRDARCDNLREVSPTLYFNVPRGFDMLLPLLERDARAPRRLLPRARR